MNKQTLVASIVALITAGSNITIMAHNAATPAGKEKCYGIAKARQNQCGTKAHACATLSKIDNDPNSWVFVPKGTCVDKNGSLAPKD